MRQTLATRITLLVMHGIYQFRPKRIAFRNDYRRACVQPRRSAKVRRRSACFLDSCFAAWFRKRLVLYRVWPSASRSSRHTSRLQMGWLCRALGLSCTLLGRLAGTGYADHLVDTPRCRSHRRIARSYTPQAHTQRSLSKGKSCRHASWLRYCLPRLRHRAPHSLLAVFLSCMRHPPRLIYKLLPILWQFTASTSTYASSPPLPPHR